MFDCFRITGFRPWLIALVAAAMVLAPMAAEAGHIEEQSNSHCEYCIDHSDHTDEDENHHKEHHAHGCGSCHVHCYAAKLICAFSFMTDGDAVDGSVTAALSSADLSGPFRPPRS